MSVEVPVEIYVAPEIAAVEALHPYLSDSAFLTLPIREQILQQAETLYTAHKAKDPRTRFQIVCWWPGARGRSPEDTMNAAFTLADAKETMAREYGFTDWHQVDALGKATTDPEFEAALTAMLEGAVTRLDAILSASPQVLTAKSRFGHGATLLHYLGANGVESHRQRVPLNAPDIAAHLIQLGADRSATATMYGGGQTPLALASTSAHPRNAGIAQQLNTVLSELSEAP